MKTLQEFQEYFERELRPKLLQVQTARDATRPRFWRVWRWCLLGAALLTGAVMALVATGRLPPGPLSTAPLPVAWGLTLIVVPIVLWVRINRWSGKEEGLEKTLTVVPAVRFLAPEFAYVASAHVSADRVRASRIFEMRGQWTGFSGDDRFTGKIGQTDAEFSEVRVKTSRRVQSKGRSEILRSTDIGLFLVADFHQPFRHATLVMPDPRERLFGAKFEEWVGSAIDFMNEMEPLIKERTGERLPRGRAPTPGQAGWMPLRMEDPAFERMFKVYCTDSDEARQILTPNIMERLAAFQQRMRYPLALSFVGSAMHAFIHSGALFEGDVDADVSRFESYVPYYEQLYVVFDLVEAMQLNTRLWAKP